MIQRNILVSGIVQGVGFRPTVYRIATDLNLNGSIRNLGNIVEIILEGNESEVSKFKDLLFKSLPPIAKIDTYEEKDNNILTPNYNEFLILESEDNYDGTSVIPPINIHLMLVVIVDQDLQ